MRHYALLFLLVMLAMGKYSSVTAKESVGDNYECSLVDPSLKVDSAMLFSDNNVLTLAVGDAKATITRISEAGIKIIIEQVGVTKLHATSIVEGRPKRIESELVHPFGESGFGARAFCVINI